MIAPFGEPVVWHARTRGTPDSLGRDTWVDVDTNVTGVAYPRSSANIANASEKTQGQDMVIVGLTVVFEPAVNVGPVDEFTVRGDRWAVEGQPGQYVAPSSGRTVTQVNLTRVEG